MIWILTLTLLSGLTGPVQVEREACEHVARAVAEGQIVAVEMVDGSAEIVIAAKCTEERTS